MDDLVLLASKHSHLALRANLMRSLRNFFRDMGFLEVQVPLLSPAVLPEEHINPVRAGKGYLLPSPEIYMKHLLAAGYERIYHMGSCFRHGESGRYHLPEFTMLEWYRAEADYNRLVSDCEQMLARLADDLLGSRVLRYQGREIDLEPPWPTSTVQEAFQAHAGWDPLEDEDPNRFEQDLAERVQPALETRKPTFLMDFPAYEAALARKSPRDPRTAERVELFAGGLELANGFSELIDPAEQRARFEKANRARIQRGADAFPMPLGFLEALPHMPPSAGMALGVDRLVMLFADAAHIEEVVAFGSTDS